MSDLPTAVQPLRCLLLEAVLLLELDVLHVDLVDAIDHGLDELHLGVAEPV